MSEFYDNNKLKYSHDNGTTWTQIGTFYISELKHDNATQVLFYKNTDSEFNTKVQASQVFYCTDSKLLQITHPGVYLISYTDGFINTNDKYVSLNVANSVPIQTGGQTDFLAKGHTGWKTQQISYIVQTSGNSTLERTTNGIRLDGKSYSRIITTGCYNFYPSYIIWK